MFGHDHNVFPSSDFENIEGVDVKKGTIHGTLRLCRILGDHLGIIDLTLEKSDGKWKVVDSSPKPVRSTIRRIRNRLSMPISALWMP